MKKIRLLKKAKICISLAICILIVGSFVGCGSKKLIADQPFGSFTATDINGNGVTEKIFTQSTLTMVNIWATFCGPCINEMPDLGKLNTEYKDQGFQVVGIILDSKNANDVTFDNIIESAKEIISDTGASYLHILPSKSLYAIKLNEVTAVPETVFVNSEGKVVSEIYMGSKSKAEWQSIIENLLKEQGMQDEKSN